MVCYKNIIFLANVLGSGYDSVLRRSGDLDKLWPILSFVFPCFCNGHNAPISLSCRKFTGDDTLSTLPHDRSSVSADFEIRQVCLTFAATNEIVLSMWTNQRVISVNFA